MFQSLLAATAVVYLLCNLEFASALESKETLEFVSIVFRHGNRAPLVHYKNDPYKGKFPDGVGQLTKKGKANMYQKGKVLRKMYDGFIGRNFRSDELYCTSTSSDRTLMTAQVVLAGMYPPVDSYHHLDPHLAWQPIPVHEDSPDKSSIFGHGNLCPRYSQVFYEQINKTTETLKKEGRVQEVFPYCEAHCGEQVRTVADLGLLVDALKSEAADGLKLPDWVSEIYDSTLLGFLDILMNVIVTTAEQKRLITGPLLKQILDNMSAKSKGTLKPNHKMVLYSGHDFSILGLLGSITKSKKLIPQPEFGASLAFEMYRSESNQYTVKVKYLRSFNDETPQDISIPDCGSPCTLEKFIEISQYVIPEDWEQECRIHHSGERTDRSTVNQRRKR
ncbi:hypothetical protein M8J75_009296 [Diaphorina citri]|nr:hypothetical protein M8J75_009296 [Diaphorina citri]KAI5753404.1 hypothetical protein M8J77_026546 [Diaphorina citri]